MTTWYATEDINIHVPDPGWGYLEITTSGGQAFLVEGAQLGAMLADLTTAATADTDPANPYRRHVTGLWPMTRDEARRLLPYIQYAVLHAVAGGERAERVLDPEEPRPPLCVRCDVNVLSPEANPHPNPSCETNGHRPFGSRNGVWEQARHRHAFTVARTRQ